MLGIFKNLFFTRRVLTTSASLLYSKEVLDRFLLLTLPSSLCSTKFKVLLALGAYIKSLGRGNLFSIVSSDEVEDKSSASSAC